MVRVAILGATGGVGNQLCKFALDAGHDVTILVRSPNKVPTLFEGYAEKFAEVIKGDATDENAVANLCKNKDIIISVVGTPAGSKPENCIMKKVATALLKATTAEQKIVFCSSLGMNGSSPTVKFVLKMVAGSAGVNDCNAADCLLTDNIGKEGIATITVVRPTALDDSKAKGKYKALKNGSFGVTPISRTDVAQFFADSITDPEWNNKAVHLCNGNNEANCNNNRNNKNININITQQDQHLKIL
eukprot:Pgem_evm1s4638